MADPETPFPNTRRLLLTVTTGRSGTEYLARVLALHSKVDARHEPKPRFSTSFRAVCARPEIAREFWTREKLPAIARTRRPIYAETSHLACKGFLESLVELGVVPELVHLRREPREVARSLWSLGSIPGRSLLGVRYYLGPEDRVFLPLAPELAAHASDYQLCYWYCLEIDARAEHYRRRFAARGVRVHEVALASLRERAGIEAFAAELELGPLSAVGAVRARTLAGRRVNTKEEQKRRFTLGDEELAAEEGEVRHWVGLASTPALPHASSRAPEVNPRS
jgi:hypothetical protein